MFKQKKSLAGCVNAPTARLTATNHSLGMTIEEITPEEEPVLLIQSNSYQHAENTNGFDSRSIDDEHGWPKEGLQ